MVKNFPTLRAPVSQKQWDNIVQWWCFQGRLICKAAAGWDNAQRCVITHWYTFPFSTTSKNTWQTPASVSAPKLHWLMDASWWIYLDATQCISGLRLFTRCPVYCRERTSQKTADRAKKKKKVVWVCSQYKRYLEHVKKKPPDSVFLWIMCIYVCVCSLTSERHLFEARKPQSDDKK